MIRSSSSNSKSMESRWVDPAPWWEKSCSLMNHDETWRGRNKAKNNKMDGSKKDHIQTFRSLQLMIRWFPGWRTCLLSSTLLFCLSFSFSCPLHFFSQGPNHTMTSSHIGPTTYFKPRLHFGIKMANNSWFIASNKLSIKFRPSVTCPVWSQPMRCGA